MTRARVTICSLMAFLLIAFGCEDRYDTPVPAYGDADATDELESSDLSENEAADESGLDAETEAERDVEVEEAKPDYPFPPYGMYLGDTMADFTLKDCEGVEYGLKAVYGSAKVVFISTAAGWCSACNEGMSKLEQWHQDFKEQDFVMLQAFFENAMGMPANPSSCRSWRDSHQASFPILVDSKNYFAPYYPSIQSGGDQYLAPLCIVLDRDMKIRYISELEVPDAVHDMIRDMLKEP